MWDNNSGPLMQKLPDYLARTIPNPVTNRAPWYVNTAPSYAGVFLWIAFYQSIAQGTIDRAGIGLCLLALAVAGLLSYALYYYSPAMLGMKTGFPLYVVGSSTFGTSGGYLMPGLLMGLLQIGWFAVADLPFDHLYSERPENGSAAGTLPFAIIAVIWGFLMAYIGVKGIQYVAKVSLILNVIPLVMILFVFAKTFPGVSQARSRAPGSDRRIHRIVGCCHRLLCHRRGCRGGFRNEQPRPAGCEMGWACRHRHSRSDCRRIAADVCSRRPRAGSQSPKHELWRRDRSQRRVGFECHVFPVRAGLRYPSMLLRFYCGKQLFDDDPFGFSDAIDDGRRSGGDRSGHNRNGCQSGWLLQYRGGVVRAYLRRHRRRLPAVGTEMGGAARRSELGRVRGVGSRIPCGAGALSVHAAARRLKTACSTRGALQLCGRICGVLAARQGRPGTSESSSFAGRTPIVGGYGNGDNLKHVEARPAITEQIET